MIPRIGIALLLPFTLLVGCGTPAEKTASSEGDTSKVLKIALITPGPVSDSGWNALAYDGLKEVQKELGATVDNQEAEGPKIKDSLRSYAQKGYRLVFGHGYEYNEPMVAVAQDFPETIFISSSGGKTSANAGAFRFYLEQGCFLGGMLAAKVSKTKKLGMVTFSEIPSIESTLKSFAAGAKEADPTVQVLPTVYFGNPTDIAAAKRATAQLISQGADVIVHQANAAAQGVFDACRDGNAWAIGTNANQNDNSSGVVIGSAVIVAGPAFVDLAKEVKDGRYKGNIKLVGMETGAIDFVPNPSLFVKAGVSSEILQLIETTKKRIENGDLVVAKDDF